MSEPISISKTLRIRECGYDEYWLQDQIYANTVALGLGELEVLKREKLQSSGGRLDLLLENTEEARMFEVEIMLGETNPDHIVRTIEYWDLERRRWSKRSHSAVLIAEGINRRFFNVIQLLSLTIPIIAIQANLILAGGTRILHFTKILDVYEEPEPDGGPAAEVVDENSWKEKAPATLAHAKELQSVISSILGDISLRFTKKDIRLIHAGEIYLLLERRTGGKSSFKTWLKNADIPKATAILDNGFISYDVKPYLRDTEWQVLRLTVDQKMIEKEAEVFAEIARLVGLSWSSIESV